MTRPPFEVADIVRQHGDRFLETHRTWVTGAVDSIGGVNGEIKTVYDPRGRVASDTVFRNTTAIGTSYAVDIYERRPDECRTLERGSNECLKAREQAGLPPHSAPLADLPEA